MMEEIEKLLAYGRIGLETGSYKAARECFEQVLMSDPANQEAIDGLARIDEILSRRAAFEPVKPVREERSIIGWIRKERKEYADRVAERKRLAAEEREKRAKEIAKWEDEMLASGMAAAAEPIQDEPEEKRGLPRLMQIGLILELIGTSLTLIGLLLFLLLFFMCLFPSCFKWL